MNSTEKMRNLLLTDEFKDFYGSQPLRVQQKFDYVMEVIQAERVISTKFAKRILNTELYEMRVSLGSNEYRSMLFAVDNDNLIEATSIILLNAFLKKSTKDYNKQIKIAERILKGLSNEVG